MRDARGKIPSRIRFAALDKRAQVLLKAAGATLPLFGCTSMQEVVLPAEKLAEVVPWQPHDVHEDRYRKGVCERRSEFASALVRERLDQLAGSVSHHFFQLR